MDVETRALALSAGAALILGVVALAVALATGSGAILLDGGFNLAFFAAALVTLRVARLVRRTDDRRYPFGYVQFEPLINLVKGLLILGIALFALVDAAISLAGGGRSVAAGPALIYAIFAVAACGAALVALRAMRARAASPLVAADVENWMVNLAVSAGMLVAFALALLLEHAGRDAAALFVDPLLVALVVLLTIAVPIRMVGRALGALLQQAPPPEVVASVEALTRAALAPLAPRAVHVRVLRPGRTTYALVHAVLDDAGTRLDVAAADELRRAVIAALAARHAPVIVDVVFTGVEAFAAPTTGFGPQDQAAARPPIT